MSDAQTEKLKAELKLKDSLLKSKSEQLEQRDHDQANQRSSIDQKANRITELEAFAEHLQNQLAQMTAFNTQSSIQSVASAAQGGAVNQDQGQISSSHFNQYNYEQSTDNNGQDAQLSNDY